MPVPSSAHFSRRDLLSGGCKLSLASFALLSGVSARAHAGEGQPASTQDIDILNEILGTEHEGIAAYQVCIDRNILQKNIVKTARLFQDHHKSHRDILAVKIKILGGTPVVAKAQDEYVNDLNMVVLKTQKDALHLIARLELGAANGYIGMIPSTGDHELAKIAGRIAADEVVHWTTLSQLLGMPLPSQALSFGA